jgi:hypothetical protein
MLRPRCCLLTKSLMLCDLPLGHPWECSYTEIVGRQSGNPNWTKK